jgi:hypothetical protein
VVLADASDTKERWHENTKESEGTKEEVEGAFGADIDYAMLVKLYGKGSAGNDNERRFRVTTQLSEVSDLVALLEATESQKAAQGNGLGVAKPKTLAIPYTCSEHP